VSGFEPLAYRLGASKEHLITLKGRGFRASRSFLSHSSATYSYFIKSDFSYYW